MEMTEIDGEPWSWILHIGITLELDSPHWDNPGAGFCTLGQSWSWMLHGKPWSWILHTWTILDAPGQPQEPLQGQWVLPGCKKRAQDLAVPDLYRGCLWWHRTLPEAQEITQGLSKWCSTLRRSKPYHGLVTELKRIQIASSLS